MSQMLKNLDATTSTKAMVSVRLTQEGGDRHQECLPMPPEVLLEFPPEDKPCLIWRNQHHSFHKPWWKFPDLPEHFENMITRGHLFPCPVSPPSVPLHQWISCCHQRLSTLVLKEKESMWVPILDGVRPRWSPHLIWSNWAFPHPGYL